jgi:hypothetical protein
MRLHVSDAIVVESMIELMRKLELTYTYTWKWSYAIKMYEIIPNTHIHKVHVCHTLARLDLDEW